MPIQFSSKSLPENCKRILISHLPTPDVDPLKSWTSSVMRSRLEPMKKFATMLRKHMSKIVAFIDTEGLTNAVSEGINRIVKIIKNRASGFRNLNAFSDLIFLTVGDVDIRTLNLNGIG